MRKSLKRVHVIDDEEPEPSRFVGDVSEVKYTSPVLGADLSEVEEVEDRLANLAHVQRLAEAMAPDPKEWEYRGDCSDAGAPVARCTCGHPIRYVFTIHRKLSRKKLPNSLPIGSVCIETSVPYLMQHGAEQLAAGLSAALEAHKKAIEEAKRKEREAANSERVVALTAEYTKLEAWVVTERDRLRARSASYWMPGVLYSGLGKKPKALSTAGRTAAALVRIYVTAWIACENTRADAKEPETWDAVPRPEVGELRYALKERLTQDANIVRPRMERLEVSAKAEETKTAPNLWYGRQCADEASGYRRKVERYDAIVKELLK